MRCAARAGSDGVDAWLVRNQRPFAPPGAAAAEAAAAAAFERDRAARAPSSPPKTKNRVDSATATSLVGNPAERGWLLAPETVEAGGASPTQGPGAAVAGAAASSSPPKASPTPTGAGTPKAAEARAAANEEALKESSAKARRQETEQVRSQSCDDLSRGAYGARVELRLNLRAFGVVHTDDTRIALASPL